MGWLQRLFGQEKPADVQTAISGGGGGGGGATAEAIPVERLGLNGEFDQSGLAKRVALAFDQNNELKDIDSVFVAQTGTTVVLKGKAPSQAILDKLESVARGVNGAQAVDSSQVTIGQ
jgi:osmotically-inducible protein OsmY